MRDHGWLGALHAQLHDHAELVHDARTGILVSSDIEAGACLVTANMITGATNGAIRAMTLGEPLGPDLAAVPADATRVCVTANLVS